MPRGMNATPLYDPSQTSEASVTPASSSFTNNPNVV